MRSWRMLGACVLLAVLASGLVVVRPTALGRVMHTIIVGLIPDYLGIGSRLHRVFVLNVGDNTVSVIDASNGNVLHTVVVGHAPIAVAVDNLTDRAFVLNGGDNSVSMLNAASGEILRTVHVGNIVRLVAVDEESGHVFVGTGDTASNTPGTSYMLDARTGAVLHTAVLGGIWPRGVAVDPYTHRVFVTNNEEGTVSVLDSLSGRVRRTVTVGAGPLGIAIDARANHVFVVNSADFTVSMLDGRSGTVLRTVRVGGQPATIAVDTHAGRVFVVNRGDNTVSVLDTRTGTELRRVAIGAIRPPAGHYDNPIDVVVDEQNGRVYILNGSPIDRSGNLLNGSVSVLDSRSGRALHTLAVGRAPVTLAVDEVTAHLFVLNSAGDLPSRRDSWGWVPGWLRTWLPWIPHRASSTRSGSVTVINTMQQ